MVSVQKVVELQPGEAVLVDFSYLSVKHHCITSVAHSVRSRGKIFFIEVAPFSLMARQLFLMGDFSHLAAVADRAKQLKEL